MKTVMQLLQAKGTEVHKVGLDARVYDALKLMAEKNIGAMPVVENGVVIGLISERDYTRKIALQGKSSRETPVAEIMNQPVISVTSATTIDACMQIVTRQRVRHLPVIDDGRLVGMVSIGDLVNWIISAQNVALEQMESYIMGGYAG